MKIALHTLSCFVMAVALAPHPPAAARCALKPLLPRDGKVVAATVSVNLGDADQPATPTAWQGPLTKKTCRFEIGIIEQPLALTPSGLMYVTTYSGSMKQVTLFDVHACSIRWQSESFAGKVVLRDSALRLGTKRVALDEQCVPEPDPSRR